MISHITGKIIEKNKNSISIQTAGGVGYALFISPLKVATSEIGSEISLHTYLKVGENAMDLYGFETREEKNFFTLLLTVSGIGPKTAMNILTLGSLSEIQNAISRGDATYLTAVSGMGKKTAERLIVELKGKLSNLEDQNQKSGQTDAITEVIDALESMGYAREEAKRVALSLDAKEKTTNELLKAALRQMK